MGLFGRLRLLSITLDQCSIGWSAFHFAACHMMMLIYLAHDPFHRICSTGMPFDMMSPQPVQHLFTEHVRIGFDGIPMPARSRTWNDVKNGIQRSSSALWKAIVYSSFIFNLNYSPWLDCKGPRWNLPLVARFLSLSRCQPRATK